MDTQQPLNIATGLPNDIKSYISGVFLKKWYFHQKKRMELDPQTNIHLKSVSPEERHKHIYMATPLSALKKAKMVCLPEKRMELQA